MYPGTFSWRVICQIPGPPVVTIRRSKFLLGDRAVVDAPPLWVYWLGGILLLLANVAYWVATFFTLPGNWGIVVLAALFAVLLPERKMGWE